MRNRSKSLPVVALLALLAAACHSEAAKPEVGRAAPDFTLQSLDGAKVRLSDLKGKVVFVNLWATWCPPCKQEMPSMVRLYEMFRGKGLEIVAVSEDRDLGALRRFVKNNGVTFPVVPDEDMKVYGLYRATGVPETHLIDKKGILKASQLGPFDWTDPSVVELVQKLLRE